MSLSIGSASAAARDEVPAARNKTRGIWRSIVVLAALFGMSAGVAAKELHMVAPNIPPHFDQNGRGRIADVVRASLERCGHTVKFTVVPFGRHWKEYAETGAYDGLATAEADQTFPGYTTKPFIHLQDGATVIARPDLLEIRSPDQLAGKRIVAFPAADKILEIEALVPRFQSFNMRAERFDQIRPLFAGRADAVLADGLITAHFIELLRERQTLGQEPDINPAATVIFRRIFAPGPQRLYFREQQIATDFDDCAARLRADGSMDRITRPYVDRYRNVLGQEYPDN